MTDIEIQRSVGIKEIKDIIEKYNINEETIDYYGKYKAKIDIKGINQKTGKLILVTATNPTPYGEGKTTVSIGLNDALNAIGKKSIVTLREPSLGPVFGLKGGATGGGYAQVIPMEDINLHFNGDFHAITSANNLLCAAIDNHIKFGNSLNIDINKIMFNRCIDMNDRTLRYITIGQGGTINGIPRTEHFNITAASEIMVIFCLAKDLNDLEKRLGNILVAYSINGNPVYARDLKVEGAMVSLLKEAFKPNIVQTLEGNLAVVHGGPFANIAHGCNSLVATRTSLTLADYVVTEAGFGSDLGAEKFIDIKCQLNNLKPNCVVLVTTIKSLKYNAYIAKEHLFDSSTAGIEDGLSNLEAHISNLNNYNVNYIVCLNKYASDTDEQINIVKNYCLKHNIMFSICNSYEEGKDGSIDLANKVISLCNNDKELKYLYDFDMSIKDKIYSVASKVYHASHVNYTKEAEIAINEINSINPNLPICIAKTQYSISDDKEKLGFPKDYEITVKNVKLYNGAGIITVFLGDIMTMPGMPKNPNYENVKLDENNEIIGIF